AGALDASNTVNALAAMLADRHELLVCTKSVPTFQMLTRAGGPQAHLTGGGHEPATGSLVRPMPAAVSYNHLTPPT
ncbi:sugar phosphate isomerase family, partial [Leucobacter celer]|uniref:hypothetical protein n=1 Tax=Leucobacter celer TaxID=668625 RepID=UPI000A7CC07F